MHIHAFDGKFGVAMGVNDFDYQGNGDGTLTVRAKKGSRRTYLSVHVERDQWIEAVDKKGSVVTTVGEDCGDIVIVGKEPITLRFKKLPKPRLSKVDLDKARHSVTRYVISDKPFNMDLPDTLAGMIEWMQAQFRAIPKEHRKTARFRFDIKQEYGETYPQIEITYEAPETDKELIRRLQVAAERTRLAEIQDRAKYEKLKVRFAESDHPPSNHPPR